MMGAEVLGKLSGLSADDIKNIAAQVKINHEALTACAGHAFAVIDSTKLMPRYRCANCGGEVDSHAAHWYQRGREHAGKP